MARRPDISQPMSLPPEITESVGRDEGWFEAFLRKHIFPKSKILGGHMIVEHFHQTQTSSEVADHQLTFIADNVNAYFRDGLIDKDLLTFHYGSTDQLLRALASDDGIISTDKDEFNSAWSEYVSILYRWKAQDFSPAHYADDPHDFGMKQIPLALLQGEEGAPFLSMDLHESPRSILVQWGKPELMHDVVASVAYAADAMDVAYGYRDRIAQYLIADPGLGGWKSLYQKMMAMETYGDSVIENGVGKNNPLFHALNALSSLERSRIAPDNPLPEDPRYHYLFYLPNAKAFRARNEATWQSLIQPLLDNPNPNITLIIGEPYREEPSDIAAEWILHGAMTQKQYVRGYGRLNGFLRTLPPHHVAFTGGDGEVRTALILKP